MTVCNMPGCYNGIDEDSTSYICNSCQEKRNDWRKKLLEEYMGRAMQALIYRDERPEIISVAALEIAVACIKALERQNLKWED